MTMPDDATLRDFDLRWARMGAPQRPPPVVADALRALLADGDGLTLQLGVTPEIALVPRRSVAVDWNARMVGIAWPGGASHRAVLGDWKALPIGDASVDAVIGDGSLTMLRWPDEYHLVFARLAAVLRPGGRVALRCFANSEAGERFDALRRDTLAGAIGSFDAFRLRFNMAVAAELGDPNPTSDAIHRAFESHYPDRDALAEAAGWPCASIDLIDSYAGSAFIHSYPARSALCAIAGTARIMEVGGYEGAEHCPLLIIDKPRA